MTRKQFLWFILTTVVLAMGIFLTWPRTRHGGYPQDIDKWLLNLKQTDADLMMENVKYINNRGGRDEWVLQAQFARYFKTDEKVHLENVQTKFLLKSGKLITLSGKQAIYDTKSKGIKLWGDVSAITLDGERFYTDVITYNEKGRFLRTPEKVVIRGSKMNLRGEGLTYELATGNLSIWKDVQVVTQKRLK